MIIKMAAMLANEFMKEYRALQKEETVDESVMAFSSGLAPTSEPPEEVTTTLPPTILGFNKLTAAELRDIRCLMRELKLL